jgi:hypothetical protein
MRSGNCGKAKRLRDVFCLNGDFFRAVMVGGEGCGFGWFVRTEVEDAADNGFHRAGKIVGAQPMGDYFPFRAVFLRGEGKRNGSGGVEVVEGRREKIEEPIVDVKFNVLQSKRSVVGRGTGVLARS